MATLIHVLCGGAFQLHSTTEHYKVDGGLYTALHMLYMFAMATMTLHHTTAGCAELERLLRTNQGLLMQMLRVQKYQV